MNCNDWNINWTCKHQWDASDSIHTTGIFAPLHRISFIPSKLLLWIWISVTCRNTDDSISSKAEEKLHLFKYNVCLKSIAIYEGAKFHTLIFIRNLYFYRRFYRSSLCKEIEKYFKKHLSYLLRASNKVLQMSRDFRMLEVLIFFPLYST